MDQLLGTAVNHAPASREGERRGVYSERQSPLGGVPLRLYDGYFNENGVNPISAEQVFEFFSPKKSDSKSNN